MGAQQSRPLREVQKDQARNMDLPYHDSVEVIKIRKTTSDTHDDSTLAAQSVGMLRPKACFGRWVIHKFESDSRSNVLTEDTFSTSPDLNLIVSTSALGEALVSPLQDSFVQIDSNLESAFRTNLNYLLLPSLGTSSSHQSRAKVPHINKPKKIYDHIVDDARHPFFRQDEVQATTPKFCGFDFEALSLWGLAGDSFECSTGLCTPFSQKATVDDQEEDEHDLLLNVELPYQTGPQHDSIEKERLIYQASYREGKGQLASAQACLEQCLEMITAPDVTYTTGRAEILHKLGVVQWKSGKYQDSLVHLHEALTIYEQAFQCAPSQDIWAVGNIIDKSEVIAEVLNNIGRVNQSIGAYSQATKCFRRSLGMLVSVLPAGDDVGNVYHPSYAFALIGIGNVYHAVEKSGRAICYFSNGLIVQRACLGRNHVDVAATLNSLGAIEGGNGKYDEAMDYHDEALWIYKSQTGYGSLPVDVAVTLNHIGFIHFLRGDFDMAMENYCEALKIMESALGKGHRNVATTMYNMGLVHAGRGQFDSAIQIFTKVLSIQQLALGNLHTDVALTMDSIADLYEKLNLNEKASQFGRKSLRIRRKTLGEKHWYVGLSLVRLGKIYTKLDEKELATQMLLDARMLYLSNGLAPDDGRVIEVDNILKATMINLGPSLEVYRPMERLADRSICSHLINAM